VDQEVDSRDEVIHVEMSDLWLSNRSHFDNSVNGMVPCIPWAAPQNDV